MDDKKTFNYEPKPVKGSRKNPECSLDISGNKYFFEVKSPNMENSFKKLDTLLNSKKCVIHFDSRILELSDEQKQENITSTDSKVKDF